jgi:YVTN family beta-propeller protein
LVNITRISLARWWQADPPLGEDVMKFQTCRPLAIAAFVFCCLVGGHSRAQNAYSPNFGSNTVSVIATATNTVVDVPGSSSPAICVGSNPFGVAVTPDGNKVYVANTVSNTVSVIATATNAVSVPPIAVGELPFAFGVFIQPPARFAGTPGFSNCHGQSVSALAKQYGVLNAAAAALGFASVAALQNAIMAFCEG